MLGSMKKPSSVDDITLYVIFPFSPESLSVAVTVTTAFPAAVCSARVTWGADILIKFKHKGQRNNPKISLHNTVIIFHNDNNRHKIALLLFS